MNSANHPVPSEAVARLLGMKSPEDQRIVTGQLVARLAQYPDMFVVPFVQARSLV